METGTSAIIYITIDSQAELTEVWSQNEAALFTITLIALGVSPTIHRLQSSAVSDRPRTHPQPKHLMPLAQHVAQNYWLGKVLWMATENPSHFHFVKVSSFILGLLPLLLSRWFGYIITSIFQGSHLINSGQWAHPSFLFLVISLWIDMGLKSTQYDQNFIFAYGLLEKGSFLFTKVDGI